MPKNDATGPRGVWLRRIPAATLIAALAALIVFPGCGAWYSYHVDEPGEYPRPGDGSRNHRSKLEVRRQIEDSRDTQTLGIRWTGSDSLGRWKGDTVRLRQVQDFDTFCRADRSYEVVVLDPRARPENRMGWAYTLGTLGLIVGGGTEAVHAIKGGEPSLGSPLAITGGFFAAGFLIGLLPDASDHRVRYIHTPGLTTYPDPAIFRVQHRLDAPDSTTGRKSN